MTDYSRYIWFDGKIIPFKEGNIHVMSHCIHYGSAVFEGIKCYSTSNGPAIFKLKEHMDRLHHSANNYNMKISYSSEQLCFYTS